MTFFKYNLIISVDINSSNAQIKTLFLSFMLISYTCIWISQYNYRLVNTAFIFVQLVEWALSLVL